MNLFNVYPINDIEITKGLGSYVWDKNGIKYLDMYGGHAVISIGHTHPHYVRRLTDQLKQIGFYSNSVKISPQEVLAEKLGALSGKENYQLFMCNSGAEANENALKLASFHNKKKKVISFKGAFHGRTSLAVSVTDNPKIIAPVNTTDHVIFLPLNDSEALENAFLAYTDDLTAVIIEGIQGVGGIKPADAEFLQKIRSLCDKHDVCFIADSVQCGYGRTGQFFAHDFAGIDADIYTMAKGIGNGFPVGAIIASPKFEAWYGMLGTTFGGNHLACAAAIAVLEVIKEENLLQNASETGSYLIKELSKFKQVIEVRGRGLMIGIELPEELGQVKKDLLFKHHIFTGEAKPNVIRLLPALNLNINEADLFLEAFNRCLS